MAKDALIKFRVSTADKLKYEQIAQSMNMNLTEFLLNAAENFGMIDTTDERNRPDGIIEIPCSMGVIINEPGDVSKIAFDRIVAPATERKHHPSCKCLMCKAKKGLK